MFQRIVCRLLSFVLLLTALGCLSAASAQSQRILNAAETELALKKLGFLGSVLYIAAHPDDENTALLAYLANERLARTAYLSITRGDGGQNLIGSEKGDLLGIIRTQELLAARRIDGAEQYFTRAVDFGYSKSAEETLRIWNHEEVLSDVVWVIRKLRPDVVISRFPPTGSSGHGQHTATGILAKEAFEAAGDPTRFPEQLKYVQPWKPKRLLWNAFRFQRDEPEDPNLFKVDVGLYNPLLGKSYNEIAAASRSMHKSQGFGSAERRGPAPNYFALLGGEPISKDLFDGVETSWRRVPGGERVQIELDTARREWNSSTPEKIIPALVRAYGGLKKLDSNNSWVQVKRLELLDIIRSASGLWIEAITSQAEATAGEAITVNTTVINRSNYPFQLLTIEPSNSNQNHTVNKALENNQPISTSLKLQVPASAVRFQPYWLRKPPAEGLHSVENQQLVGTAENASAMSFRFKISAEDQILEFDVPASYRWVDRVRGEQYRDFNILPAATLGLENSFYIFPDGQPKQVKIVVRAHTENLNGGLRLALPPGWKSTPSSDAVALKTRGETTVSFLVTPPANDSIGTMLAELDANGQKFSTGMVTIDHPHIPVQHFFPAAEAKLVRMDLRRTGTKIGYIMGPGDEVPESLRQAGYDVELLSDEQLAEGDLKKFHAIVTGVRAYNTRPRLRQLQGRLIEYVKDGGTLLVQYNTVEESIPPNLGPYPFKISRDRVSVEDAPVKLLDSDDPLLTSPNKVTLRDFEGWVQERGLYFAAEWNERYRPLISSNDPGESEKLGSVIVADYGKGRYVYTGISFFRQLPAGVPGAYRLFVNLISPSR